MKAEEVEQYINDEMQEEHQMHFEHELEKDADLWNLVKSTKQLIFQLKQKGFIQKIRLSQPKPVSFLNKYKAWIIVLRCILVLGGTIYMFFNASNSSQIKEENPETVQPQNSINIDTLLDSKNTKPKTKSKQDSSQELLENNLKPPKAPPIASLKTKEFWARNKQIAMDAYSTPRQMEFVRGGEINSILDSAKLALNNEEFQKTLKLIEKSNISSQQMEYFKAIIFYNLGDYKTAKSYFSKINFNDKPKSEELEWYNMLTDLACGPTCFEQFKLELKQILANPNHVYFRQAKYISEKVKN